MATEQSFVDYVCDQLIRAPEIRAKKMFGEYALFCGPKLVALICDNQFFLKQTQAGRKMLKVVKEVPPYKSAKPAFLIDEQLEDAELMVSLIEATAQELPMPKPKSMTTQPITPKARPAAKSKAK